MLQLWLLCKSILVYRYELSALQEDFQPMSYGFKMAGDVTDSRALGMLKEMEDELFKLSKVMWWVRNTHSESKWIHRFHEFFSSDEIYFGSKTYSIKYASVNNSIVIEVILVWFDDNFVLRMLMNCVTDLRHNLSWQNTRSRQGEERSESQEEQVRVALIFL